MTSAPCGLRRTMTADLTRTLPAGTRRIRIWTNLKIYWDQVLIDTTPAGAVPAVRHEAPLLEASLDYRGFPRERPGTPAADLTYVHDEVSPYGPYARHRGFYTRYGDVRPLVGAIDDRFTIFGAGDEVSSSSTPRRCRRSAAAGRANTSSSSGYVKDMDFYAAHAQTVSPLPSGGCARILIPRRNATPSRTAITCWSGTPGKSAPKVATYRFDFTKR